MMNEEVSKNKPTPFKLKKIETIKSIEVYNRLINWVAGEFDLYLKNESDILKVYFPNGWFSIRSFKNKNNKGFIEVKVEGKSTITCKKMMNQLEQTYNHIVRFTETKVNV